MRGLRSLILFALLFLHLTASSSYAAEYVAFSLKVAQEKITKAPKGQVPPEVFNLGGITAVRGLVYDRKTGDLILVGGKDPQRAPLTLDDFVVALGARFIHGKWPLVSIDPIEETKKTELQIVRFEGGIEDTQVGVDFFDADYRLKQIGMGLLPSGVELKTYWDLGKERTGGSYRIGSRFWFYPVIPSVSVREDVVSIKGLKVGVFTEVLSAEIDGKKIEDLSTFQDSAGDTFAKALSENFEKLAKVHPSFSRLQGLDELVALSKAIEDMDEKPDLTFWLRDYRVKQVKTLKEVKVLKRHEEHEAPIADGAYTRYRELSGGVQLMAIALRLKAGDVTALKEAVLKTRPKPDALSWGFLVEEWLISISPGMFTMADIVPLFTHSLFLLEKKRYDDAITFYGKIIELKPDWDWAYNNRGLAYAEGKGLYDQAIADFNKAIEINPRLAEAYNNRGAAYQGKSQYDQAISDYDRALEINSKYATAYIGRGAAYHHKGQYDQAIPNYDRALEINPRLAEAYNNRGKAYADKGFYDQAILDCTEALWINPRFGEAYNNRGIAYRRKGLYDQAVSDFDRALEINPRDAAAYTNRGNVYEDKSQYEQAISDYNSAIKINPRLAEAYNNRGNAYARKGQYDQAISDYNKALEINPQYADAYVNRGLAYAEGRGLYDRAISDYNRALEINPRLAEAYLNKALACEEVGHIKEAVETYKRFIHYAPPQYASYIEQVRQRIRELERSKAKVQVWTG